MTDAQPKVTKAQWLSLVSSATIGAAMLLATPAHAESELERNFAGSAQLDYLRIVTRKHIPDGSFDGFTSEVALKLAVDFNESISANVKVCYGCHGIESDMVFFDIRVVDQLNFRVGRMNPSFGNYPLRHDPANHLSASNPLPYDMGRMLRKTEWNMSVLPSPYTDNGIEINGTHWIGDSVQLDYAAYAVSGFKGSNDGFDLDFIQSRSGSLYYVDNNSEPAFGGRLGITSSFGDLTATLGFSGMYGHYDPKGELEYMIGGADLFVRYNDLVVRAEYLIRRTEFFVGSNPNERFQFEVSGKDGQFFVKDGFYAEVEYPLAPWFDGFFRWDGMRRKGNLLTNAALNRKSHVYRYTIGGAFPLARGFRVKVSSEIWDFSNYGREVGIHTGVAANF